MVRIRVTTGTCQNDRIASSSSNDLACRLSENSQNQCMKMVLNNGMNKNSENNCADTAVVSSVAVGITRV
jgi:hypothetical protein